MHPVAIPVAQPRTFDLLVRAIASGSLDAESVTATEERTLLAGLRSAETRLLAKIHANLMRSATRTAQRDADRLRRAMSGRFLALWRTLPAALRDKRDHPPKERDALRAVRLRSILDLLERVGDFRDRAAAMVFAKRKANRMSARGHAAPQDRRVIFQFGWIDKARQRLIARSLSPFANYHPSQFMLRQSRWGRGRSGVCEYLRERLPTLPRETVFVQVDVRNFFGSISSTWIERHFRLPLEMIRRHVHSGVDL